MIQAKMKDVSFKKVECPPSASNPGTPYMHIILLVAKSLK